MDRRRLAVTLITAVLALVAACGGEQQVLPTATPEAETKTKTQVQTVSTLEPQTQTLMLRLTSPEFNLVTGSDRVSVAGVTSPDATLSVNGHLVFPDVRGRFSISLDRPEAENPWVIEVVATSIIGESESRLRPVIFSRQSGSGKSGIFGTVSAVAPSEITLLTDSGPVTLSIGAATMVRIHGWESPSVSNIDLGTPAAVLTDGSRAVSVQAVPSRPLRTRHFSGLVAGRGLGGSVTLRDDSGRQVTANAANGVDAVVVGELVTAVLEQDLATGELTVTALDGASESARRLFAALDLNLSSEESLAQDNLSALRWRLTEHSASHLSNLIAMDTGPLAAAKQLYSPALTKHRAGKTSADVTGMVTLLNSATGQIMVQPEQGGPVTVRVGQTTPVALFGERIRSGQLDLASRVTIIGSCRSFAAMRSALSSTCVAASSLRTTGSGSTRTLTSLG